VTDLARLPDSDSSTPTPEPGGPLETIGTQRLLPVIVLHDAADAVPLVQALKRAGSTCAEVTFRTPAAADALRAIAQDSDITLGAGTVLTVDQVDLAIDAGAQYVVTPGFSPHVVRACQERGVPVVPGVATATELQMALDAGLELVKFFPAGTSGGAAHLKALSAPFPTVRFIPTGGISSTNVVSYLAHPAVLAVGGSWMVSPALVAAQDFDEITRRTAEALSIIRSAGDRDRSEGSPR
jgi:2-dehydro-3-deoxyphosphogluconate aldolase/(4S)-4-hydroxy-2-oxoglutarate aldolase